MAISRPKFTILSQHTEEVEMSLTADEVVALKSGETTEEELEEKHKIEADQAIVDAMSTRDFLIGVTNETIDVPVGSQQGCKVVTIRARLSKRELKPFKVLMETWRKVLIGALEPDALETPEMEDIRARFLAKITVDSSLDYDFWIGGDYDAQLVQEVEAAYFTEPLKRKAAIGKFR